MSRRKIPPPESFAEVMGLFPNMRELAERMGVKYYTLASWRLRNFVPPQYWDQLIAQAERYDLAQITEPLLIGLMKRRADREKRVRQRGAPAKASPSPPSRRRDNDTLASRSNRH